jgi:hypothetical protein
VYVTRFQKERWSEKEKAYPTVDAKFLDNPEFSRASVLHPLPRVGELDASVDSDRRAVYFQQAAYGVPVRMALISLLLGTGRGKALSLFPGGFDRGRVPEYDQPRNEGLACTNVNCIVHDPSESPYVRNKFFLVRSHSQVHCKLRCAYCETDVDEFVLASKKNKWFSPDIASVLRSHKNDLRDLLAFSSEVQARKAGYHLRRQFGSERSRSARLEGRQAR